MFSVTLQNVLKRFSGLYKQRRAWAYGLAFLITKTIKKASKWAHARPYKSNKPFQLRSVALRLQKWELVQNEFYNNNRPQFITALEL